MKKNGMIILVFLSFIILLVACSNNIENKPSIYEDETFEKSLSVFIDENVMMASSLKQMIEQHSRNIGAVISIYEKDVDLMTTEILSGEGPDIILVGSGEFTGEDSSAFLYSALEQGYFLELSQRLEEEPLSSDGNVSEALLKAGQYDGKQYLIPFGFHVPLLICPKTTEEKYALSLRDDMTTEELFDVCQQPLTEGKWLFSGPILSFGEYLLATGVKAVDSVSGEVFIRERPFLEAARQYAVLEQQLQEMIEAGLTDLFFTSLKNDKALCFFRPFSTGTTLATVLTYLRQEGNTEASIFLGPISQGGTRVALAKYAIGIKNTCQAQDEAWRYVQELLTYYSTQICPTPVESSFSIEFDIMDQHHNWTKIDGKSIVELSDEALKQKFVSYLSEAEGVLKMESGIEELLETELKPYFQGKESLDTCITILENKLNLYLNE